MKGQKSALKDTRWVCERKEFVADAGTMTETFTLSFTSDKECTYTQKWFLPAHPAMYMNADGTVSTIAASGDEVVNKGTWTLSGEKITVTFEDGKERSFLFRDGKIFDTVPYLDGTGLVYEKAQAE